MYLFDSETIREDTTYIVARKHLLHDVQTWFVRPDGLQLKESLDVHSFSFMVILLFSAPSHHLDALVPGGDVFLHIASTKSEVTVWTFLAILSLLA